MSTKTTKTVAGPFSEQAARETAKLMGERNHSTYSMAVKDADGFYTAPSRPQSSRPAAVGFVRP